jgi:DNA-binding response OmpR family regulator
VRVLVVDDEKAMVMALIDNLECEGYEVDSASGGEDALACLAAQEYSLVILDVMMPDIDGFEVVKRMHSSGNNTPVIFLTARSIDEDKILGLGLGADDYVTKPFNLMELMARVKAVLRRTTVSAADAFSEDDQTLSIGDAVVDFAEQEIRTPTGTKSLGKYELAIIRLMASKPGKVFSRDDLLRTIWGVDAYPSNRTIDNYMVKMRKKIEPDPQKPRYLISLYASGYKLILD